MRFILIQVAIVGSLKITPLSNHTIEDFTSTLRSSLQTAYKTFPFKIQHSLLATEWQELQLSCNDENVTWYHSNFFINKHKSFLQAGASREFFSKSGHEFVFTNFRAKIINFIRIDT